MNFIGYKQFKLVNLDLVSSIGIDRNNNKKIIFNLGHAIKIFDDKVTSDYTYWYYDSDVELNEILFKIKGKLRNFLEPEYEYQHFINLDRVSNIKIDKDRLRIIFNFGYSVSLPNQPEKLTGDFEFWKFNTEEELQDVFSKIKHRIL